MRNRLLFLLASLLVSVASFAQWTKPADPASTPLAVGQECYLYNKSAGGYLLGANDWGTRASVSATLGHKVYIENGTAEGSYYLTNYVLQGGMANQIGYMFVEGLEGIWVDNTKEGKPCNQYTFQVQSDGSYKIGLSNANTGDFKDDNYPGACIGLIPEKNDTRLYVCETEGNYDFSTCQILWIFVTPEAYEKHVAAVKQYNAAVALGAVIEEAQTWSVDVSAAQAVYKNTSSTVEQLDAARVALAEAVKNAAFSGASIEKPYTVAFFDFEDQDASAWTSSVSAQNKGASNGNNAADYAATGIHYENWNPSNFTVGGKISTVAKGMPAGVYHLTALAFSSSGNGVNLFAEKGKAPVTGTKISTDQAYELYTFLQATQDLEYGLQVEANKLNWTGLDNVKLEYIGTSKEAYQLVKELVFKNAPEVDEDAYCQKSLYEAYKEAKTALENATEPAEMAKAIDAFETACAALEPSVAAYEAYRSKVDEAEEWLDSAKGGNEDVDLLADYLSTEEEPAEGEYNGNGTAVYILTNGLLATDKVTAETAYLEKILKAAMAAGMSDGDDCTSLLKNPNFTEEGGWNAAQGIDWPVGGETFRVMQAWGKYCDVYQQLTGLQNGIYEMNLQSVYKPGDDADKEIYQCYAYINDFDSKVNLPAEDATLNSAEDASAAFAESKYPTKVYGLVSDGTMKIGVANRLRTHENGILWAGGVKLTFRAKNEEACASMTAVLSDQAKNIQNNYCGTSETSALSSAVAAAESASTEKAYNALKALKVAIDDVNNGTTIYANLNTALANLKDAIDSNKSAEKSVLDEAQKLYDEALQAYNAKSYDNAAAEQALSDVKAMTTTVKMSKSSEGDAEQDYTNLIVNNNFDPAKGDKNEKRIDGWQVEGALNGYKEYSCSFNKGTFNLSQTLEGLPKGKYKVTVQTYYRAGSYEEEAANINAGKDTHLMKFYANTSVDNYVTSIMNLSEGSKGVTLPEGISTSDINGITVPNGTGASVKCYEAGLFLNELEFNVGEDGKVVIGLRLDETIGTNDYTVVGPWHLYYYGDESSTEADYTNLIENNNFDPAKGDKNEKRIDGWQVEGALNGYKEYSCSFNKGTFNLSQDLEGLPKGKYKVTVQTYYRAGSYEEEAANINAGKDTHLMKFYANTSVDNYVTSIMNLSEGSKGVTLPEGISTSEINGITVPNGTGASVKCYAAGLFLNELTFNVGDDGKATIGLRLDETIGTNDYTVVGPWHLYYYGSASPSTAIEEVEVAPVMEMTPVAYYSISGAKLSAPQKGVNIVKMSNGKTVKMLVK